MTCDVYVNKCLRDICYLEYSGDDNSVFFLSKHTCTGDEKGWDFISMVKASRISFTAFCKEMTERYRTNNMFSAPFMSVHTFIKWIFAWMASMQIDFRKEVDPWCKYIPKTLACDGTHVGISLRHLKLESPVTAHDQTMEQVTPVHKR